MAREKALYEGHAVAAVAAISAAVAKKALTLIKVDYEVLPHVTDVDEAMKPTAPVLHADIFTDGVEPKPKKASNVACRHEFGHGDVEEGFKEADIIVERSFKTAATHQGYIEPHACLASVGPDGQGELWVCTQGHFMVRNTCAALLGMDMSKLRVTASEIGGGFGGKTTVFIEPVALALSRKANRPVKVVMSREEVFKATGPTASSTSIDVKIGVKKDGRITAAEAELRYQGGAFPGSLVDMGAMTRLCLLRPGEREDRRLRRGLQPAEAGRLPRARRADGGLRGREHGRGAGAEARHELHRFPPQERGQEGTKSSYGPVYPPIGIRATLEAAKNHPHYKAPLGPNQGRGVACGFWFNFGGQTCISLNLNIDGTVGVAVGTPDIGGSRASMCLMAAEELGIPYEKVRTIVADTSSLGYNDVTDGSRTTFATGMATIVAARDAIKKLCERAAKTWGISPDAVVWENGYAKPAGSNAGNFEPLSLADLAANAANTGGPIAGHYEINADGAGVSFATHMVRYRSGQGDRQGPGQALHRVPGCRQGHPSQPMSKASFRAARCRASAGR